MLLVGLHFIQFCDKTSPDYDPSYCEYDEISQELFHAEEVWISRDLLLKETDLVETCNDFTIWLSTKFQNSAEVQITPDIIGHQN